MKFRLKAFDQCTRVFEPGLGYELSIKVEKFQPQDTLGTINLPDTGTYKLKLFLPDIYSADFDSIDLNIDKQENEFKINFRKIYVCSAGMHQPTCGFLCCDGPCEGKNTDYYSLIQMVL